MKIPSFVPLIESQRRVREITGAVLEILVWAYALFVFARICVAEILMPVVEDWALENELPWAVRVIELTGYDSRYISFSWQTVFALLAIGGVMGFLYSLTGRSFGTWVASISKLQVNAAEDSIKISKHWSHARKEGILLALLTLLTGWVVTKVSIPLMLEIQGLQGFGRLVLQLSCGLPLIGLSFSSSGGASVFQLLQSLMNGVFSFWNEVFAFFGSAARFDLMQLTCSPPNADYYGLAIGRLSESIYLAFIATVFAIPVAFLLAFFAARNLTKHSAFLRFVYVAVRTYMNVTRSIEPLIWAILFSVWVGIGPFSGAIALMIHSISSLVKLYSEAIEGVDEGPLEALQASGANRIATAWYAVVPQVTLPYLAFTIYRWDINVRMATIIGLVGGGGIGGLLIQEQGLANWTHVGTIAFLIFLVVWSMDFVSAKVREAIQ